MVRGRLLLPIAVAAMAAAVAAAPPEGPPRRLRPQRVRVTNTMGHGGQSSTLESRVLLQSSTKTFRDGSFVVPDTLSAGVQLGNTASYSLTAWIKTRLGGTIVAKTSKRWVANCKSLYIHRSGTVEFAVAYVGSVTSHRRVNDNRWHHIALTYNHPSQELVLHIDGHLSSHKVFDPEQDPDWAVLQLGFTTTQYPYGRSHFQGQISDLTYWKHVLTTKEIRGAGNFAAATRVMLRHA